MHHPDINRHSRRARWSWALYDFANTIYSAIVVTLYLPLYLNQQTGKNWPMGVAMFGSLLLAAFLVPFLGAVADRTGRTKQYLFRLTVLCCLCAASLGLWTQTLLILFFFFLANIAYQSSLVFYNSLLPTIAQDDEQGWLSGIGVALGYLGVIFAIPIAHWASQHWHMNSVFFVAGFLFFIFAIPLFLWVPADQPHDHSPLTTSLFKERATEVTRTIFQLPRYPILLFFLIGNFFCVDAVNASIAWFSVYTKSVFNTSQSTLILLFLALNAMAFLGGLVMGKLTHRFGAVRIIFFAVICFMIAILSAVFVHSLLWFSILVLSFGGFGISGLWTAGRRLLIQLAPEEHIGEYFGLYGISIKLSIFGSLSFALLSDWFNLRIALGAQLVSLSLGLFFLILMKYQMKRMDNASDF